MSFSSVLKGNVHQLRFRYEIRFMPVFPSFQGRTSVTAYGHVWGNARQKAVHIKMYTKLEK